MKAGLVIMLLAAQAALASAEFPRLVHAVRPETEELGGAIAATVTPDGRQVFVAGFTDDSLVAFDRDPITGAVTFARSYSDVSTEGEIYDGLDNCADAVVSPDGAFVYTAGWADSGIGIYRRLGDGNLQFVSEHASPSLAGVSDLALSADGSRLWSTAYDAAAVCAFDRDPQTGLLAVRDCITQPTVLSGARALALRPAGDRAWVAAMTSSSLTVVDDVGGTLQIGQTLIDGVAGADGLGGAYDVVVSSNEADVYVASFLEHAIGRFRAALPGPYAFADTLQHPSMMSPSSLLLGPQEDVMWAVGHDSDTILTLERDPSTGAVNAVLDTDLGALGIGGPVGIGADPTGHDLYVAGLDGNLTVISRVDLAGGAPRYDLRQWLTQEAEQHLRGIREVAVVDGRPYWAAIDGGDLVLTRADPGWSVVNPELPDRGIELFATASSAFAVSAGGDPRVCVLHDATHQIFCFELDFTGGNASPTTLGGASEMAFDPTGTDLYVASRSDSALHAYRLQPGGSLALVQNVDPGTIWVDEASSVAVSPDGLQVYVTSPPNEQITVYARDPATGILTWTPGGTSFTPVLDGVSAVRVSDDGRNVYVCSDAGDGLAVYDRDPGDGSVSLVQWFAPGPFGVDWFDGAADIAIRPGGRQVWVAAADRDAVVGLRRNPSDGTLSFLAEVTDDDPRVRGLSHPVDLAFAADGISLYVASDGAGLFGSFGGGLAVFDTARLFGDGFDAGDLDAWSAVVR